MCCDSALWRDIITLQSFCQSVRQSLSICLSLSHLDFLTHDEKMNSIDFKCRKCEKQFCFYSSFKWDLCPGMEFGGINFLKSQSVTLWQKDLQCNFWTRREILHIWYTKPWYSTNETLSSNTKVNDLVTLTVTFILKMAVLALLLQGVLQIHLAFSLEWLS